MIDGSDPDLLTEQAVDNAAGDDDTEGDDNRCQTSPGFAHCPPSVAAPHGRSGSFFLIEPESTYAVRLDTRITSTEHQPPSRPRAWKASR